MNFKTRFGGFSNGLTPQTVKTWAIGWTPTQAKAAAQKERSIKQSIAKPGMFGVLVSTGNR
jgi:hypothetical protein